MPETNANIADLLLGGEPEAIAILSAEGALTYAGLRERVKRCAAFWRSKGLRPGERCVVGLLDGADWVAAFLGLAWMGGIPIAISPRTDASLIRDLVDDSGAAALLLEDEKAASFGDSRAIGRTDWRGRLDGSTEEAPLHLAQADDPAFWLYSSGTTGKPKGIIHAHRAASCADVFAREVLGATSRDRFYSTSKLFFAYPLANALFAGLRLGASVVLDAEWPNPEGVARNIAQYRPTLFFSVPTLYRRLIEAGVSFPNVRYAVSAGEACPPGVAESWRRTSAAPLVNGYGTTETLSLVLYRTPAMPSLMATPLTRVRADLEDSRRDGAGRMWFSHPAVALGYSRVVTHDSARFGPDGFSPGDLFRETEGGESNAWSFAGRSDQLVKVFGRWVDTVALECAIGQRLAGRVLESCVVPVGGPDDGMVGLHLFAIPCDGDQAGARQAIEEVLSTYPAYQRPQTVHLVTELPRTETGKLRRSELSKRVLAGAHQAQP